jgi:hypothetical protein
VTPCAAARGGWTGIGKRVGRFGEDPNECLEDLYEKTMIALRKYVDIPITYLRLAREHLEVGIAWGRCIQRIAEQKNKQMISRTIVNWESTYPRFVYREITLKNASYE